MRQRHTAKRRRTTIEFLESRRLFTGQFFTGEGPNLLAPLAMATADVNGDGRADVISTSSNISHGTATVSLADGDGGFLPGVDYTAGYTPSDVVVADFTGDGKPDIVTNDASTGGLVVILRNNGNGTFASAVTVNTINFVNGLAVGDFNGDGKLDLATCGNASGSGSGVVGITKGNGDGTFGTTSTTGSGGTAQSIVTGDFNGDGKLDLASANMGAGTIGIEYGGGTGGFLAFSFTSTAVAANPRALVSADFNADGKADLAVVHGTGTSAVSVLIGTGFGTFSAAPTVPAVAPYDIVTGDFNADGKVDLAVSDYSTTVSTLTILTGAGTGAFTPATVNATHPTSVLAVGDFNGDARPDLVTAFRESGIRGAEVLYGQPGGAFFAPQVSSIGSGVLGGVVADFNADGIADLAAARGNAVAVALGNGLGTFAAPALFPTGSGPVHLAAGDFNRDGKIDIAVAIYSGGSGNTVSLLYGNGAGSFSNGPNVTVGNGPHTMAAADLNNDGFTDLAVGCNNNLLYRIYGSSGTPTVANTALSASLVGGIATGDFNTDGRTDLAATFPGSPNVALLTQTSTGTFTNVTLPIGYASRAIVADDFNGDGRVDLAVGAESTTVTGILIGNGLGGFAPAPDVFTDDPPEALAAADFDGDGKTDLAVTGRNSLNYGAVQTFRGLGTGAFVTPANAAGIGQLAIGRCALVGDFNGDGKADLIGLDSTGAVTTLLNRQTYSNSYVAVDVGYVTITGSGPVTVNEVNGKMTIITPTGTLRLYAWSLTHFVLNGVNATINADLGKSGGSALNIVRVEANATATSTTSQHLQALDLFGTMTLAAGGNKILRAPDIVFAGTLDLNDNDLILDYTAVSDTPLRDMHARIGSGRNGGAWNGVGLTSTTAKNNAAHATTLGDMVGADYLSIYGPTATFAGETIDATTILVRYTLYGDTDLDRGVSINDFNRLSTNFGSPFNRRWADGDLDYDGGVSINDFNLLAANFGKTLAVPAPVPQVRTRVAPHKRITFRV